MSTDYFKKYLSDDKSFHVIEDSFDGNKLGVQETIFTLGNGFIGSRGIFEENTPGSSPGTFIAGMFDSSVGQVEELVNLPNPVHFIVSSDGEKFDILTMKVMSHKRVLDMKNGLLIRRTVFKDAKKRKYLYQSVRFFSMEDPHVSGMKVSLKLLSGSPSNISVIARIDDSVFNSGDLMLPRKRHFNTLTADKEEAFDYIVFRTNYFKHLISYADAFIIDAPGRGSPVPNMDRFYQCDLKSSQEITFTKYFSIYTSFDYSEKSIKRQTMRTLNDAVETGFDELVRLHTTCFRERWQDADALIEGDPEIQRSVRFSIYHMLIAARQEYAKFGIGAKTLSGQGYRGHIFWDTEIFLLPFFIYSDPDIAKQLLIFRYNTLEQAREIAKEKGFKGVMFPWESSTSGYEQTPRYSKDSTGKIIEVKTQDMEHHITADVAYGVYNYSKMSGDTGFMLDFGAEMIFETARFWASRVKYDKSDGKYHIMSVIGPDEFHLDVDDNAYTNYMAKWNLSYAAELYYRLRSNQKIKSLKKKINLKEAEIKKWKDIADKIIILRSERKGIISQFSGYLRKKDIPLCDYDNRFLPEEPQYLGYDHMHSTSLIKQADVLALFCLFPEDFNYDTKLSNYRYYVKRTTHLSSLSYSMHSIIASDVGDFFRSYVFFLAACSIDLIDHTKNVVDGIHAANLGGIWQSLLFAFGGVRCSENEIRITPKLPGNFKELKFKFFYKGDLYQVEETKEKIKVRFIPSKKAKAPHTRSIWIFGKQVILYPNRYSVVELEDMWIETITAYDLVKDNEFVTIKQDTYVREIAGILEKAGITGVPVVDSLGRILGFVSEKNILQSTFRNRFGNLRVSDIMETRVISVDYKDSLEDVIKVFSFNSYRRIPVLKVKKVIGVIDRKDIIDNFLCDSVGKS